MGLRFANTLDAWFALELRRKGTCTVALLIWAGQRSLEKFWVVRFGFKACNVAICHQAVQCAIARLIRGRRLGKTIRLPIRLDVSLGCPVDMANEFKSVAFKSVWMTVTRAIVARQNQFFTTSGQPLEAAREIITDGFVLSHKQTKSFAAIQTLDNILALVMVRICDISCGGI